MSQNVVQIDIAGKLYYVECKNVALVPTVYQSSIIRLNTSSLFRPLCSYISPRHFFKIVSDEKAVQFIQAEKVYYESALVDRNGGKKYVCRCN